jgi:predicted PurR-regulated permease PerM
MPSNTAETAPVPPPTASGPRSIALMALSLFFIGLCVLLIIPFLPAISWAAALAILAWPMHRLVRRHVKWPSVAAALSTVIVMATILGSGAVVGYQLASEAASAAVKVQSETAEAGGLQEGAARLPVVGPAVTWLERRNIDVEGETRRFLSSFTRSIAGFTQGSLSAAIQFLVAAFILYFLFREPWKFLEEARELLPMTREESDFLLKRAADSVQANLNATVVTGLINAASFGLLFWWMGLPAPLMWTAVMFVLSVLPIVGAGLVWGPAAVYLAMSDRWVPAIILVGWGLLMLVVVGYFLYGHLVGEKMRTHDVPALLSFLGGLAVFGLSGMVLGPAILAVTMAILEVWKRRLVGPSARGAAAPL